MQIRATPLELGLPSPATLMFSCPMQGIMPIINTFLINSNNGDEQYEALVTRQTRNYKNYDTSQSYDSISIASTAAVHQENGGLWTYGTVIGRGDDNHSNRSYMIRISKTD